MYTSSSPKHACATGSNHYLRHVLFATDRARKPSSSSRALFAKLQTVKSKTSIELIDQEALVGIDSAWQ
jgi:hypothetical protein